MPLKPNPKTGNKVECTHMHAHAHTRMHAHMHARTFCLCWELHHICCIQYKVSSGCSTMVIKGWFSGWIRPRGSCHVVSAVPSRTKKKKKIHMQKKSCGHMRKHVKWPGPCAKHAGNVCFRIFFMVQCVKTTQDYKLFCCYIQGNLVKTGLSHGY